MLAHHIRKLISLVALDLRASPSLRTAELQLGIPSQINAYNG